MEDGAQKTSNDEDEVLDLRGLRCPLPALRAEKALRRMKTGDVLTVLADDPLARLDFAHLCNAGGHSLQETGFDAFIRFRIVRGEAPAVSGN